MGADAGDGGVAGGWGRAVVERTAGAATAAGPEGTVTLTVDPNPGATRDASVRVADQTLTINQGPACTFTVAPSGVTVPAAGGNATVAVTAPAGCSWQVQNLPDWLSRSQIYVVWLGITALGALGYLRHRRGYPLSGLILVGAYAGLGFDGLLHYTRAPVAAHTTAMNLTIWFEVSAAALLLGAVLILATHFVLRQGR